MDWKDMGAVDGAESRRVTVLMARELRRVTEFGHLVQSVVIPFSEKQGGAFSRRELQGMNSFMD